MQPRTFSDVVDIILNINQYIVFLIFAITFIVLLWTIVNAWILNGGNQETVNKAKGTITISIIVLVIMSGIWGILAVLKSTLVGF